MKAKRALPPVSMIPDETRYYRPPNGRMHGDRLSPEELSWVRAAVTEAMLRRMRCGEPVPPEFRRVLARLTDLLEIGTAGCATETENDVALGEWTQWVGTPEAAHMLDCTPAYVRRIAERLGGRLVGGRWMIPRRNLSQHLEGRDGADRTTAAGGRSLA